MEPARFSLRIHPVIMKKIKLPIKNIETNIILNALIQFKNDKLKQDIYTEPIDELILKLNKIY